jgi:U3 small nucleolar RNA-associated protein 24
MPRAKRTKKFAQMKRMISLRDPRLQEKDRQKAKKEKPEDPHALKITEAPQVRYT